MKKIFFKLDFFILYYLTLEPLTALCFNLLASKPLFATTGFNLYYQTVSENGLYYILYPVFIILFLYRIYRLYGQTKKQYRTAHRQHSLLLILQAVMLLLYASRGIIDWTFYYNYFFLIMLIGFLIVGEPEFKKQYTEDDSTNETTSH